MLQTIDTDGKGKIGMSNHNFEMSIINGLCQHNDIELECITIPAVFSYPYNNKRFYTRHESYRHNNTQIYSVGFCNLPVIKELWATLVCAIQILIVIWKKREHTIHVIINTPDNRLFNAVEIANCFTSKRLTKTVIIPDIPSLVTSMDHQNPIKKFILKHSNNNVMVKASECNGLVLLTEQMMDFMAKPVNHIVMEGIVDVKTMNNKTDMPEMNKEIILYSGTIRKIFGVMNLINAFRLISNINAELWICGSGDSKEEIEKAARADSRIKFFGLVTSETALKMQNQATILVNPRTSEGEYTKYSFPSKTMEYLLAGKSVIINRLPGIPEEYYKYVYTPNNEEVASLAGCIQYVLHLDKSERQQKARAGKQFVIEHKNSFIQTKKILDMIKKY